MKIETTNKTGRILVDCLNCGRMYEIDDFRQEELYASALEIYLEKNRICPACEREIAIKESVEIVNKRNKEFKEKFPALLQEAGIEFFYCHDRKTHELFTCPPVEFVAKFIDDHRDHNLLISGPTGSGKTTSACFLAMYEFASFENRKIKFVTLRKLLEAWKDAKKSDKENAADAMLRKLYDNDLLIIDEMVRKSKVTESGQELLFEILEAVNSGACRSRIWMLGNFFTGSIEEIFGDPEPVRRRLQENFICAYIDCDKQTVNRIQVWKGSNQ